MCWLPKAALGVKTELGFNFRPPRVIGAAAVLKPYHLCLQLNSWLSIEAAEKFFFLLFEFPLEHAENNLPRAFVPDCSNKLHHHSQFTHRAPEKH